MTHGIFYIYSDIPIEKGGPELIDKLARQYQNCRKYYRIRRLNE